MDSECLDESSATHRLGGVDARLMGRSATLREGHRASDRGCLGIEIPEARVLVLGLSTSAAEHRTFSERKVSSTRRDGIGAPVSALCSAFRCTLAPMRGRAPIWSKSAVKSRDTCPCLRATSRWSPRSRQHRHRRSRTRPKCQTPRTPTRSGQVRSMPASLRSEDPVRVATTM